MQNSILLYGANGYTGTLIARMASEYGVNLILAARREESVKPLSTELGYRYLVIDLNDSAALDQALSQVALVLHVAGPFKYTAKPMIEACLRMGKHYLDITGEIMVYEMAKKYHEQALAKGIMVMPGVGFDVVPTDCIALHLKNKLPDAVALKLAFAGLGGAYSRGTATTMIEGMGEKSARRIDGKITPVPLGEHGMWLELAGKKIFFMSIPWGDVSTAYHTTGIPNIETYTGASPKTFKLLKYQSIFNWLLRTSFMRNRQLKKIKKMPPGPSDDRRAKSKSVVWGEAINGDGVSIQAKIRTPEGYTLTAISSLIIARKVLEGNFKAGYQTPAGCYGEGLVFEVPGVEFI
jgi:short subunit dehydrogenase-like uncharacterized protein